MPLPRTYRQAAAEINGNLRAGPLGNGKAQSPGRGSPRPGSVGSGPGPVWPPPLGGEEFVEGTPRGIPEILLLRSGAEDVPA